MNSLKSYYKENSDREEIEQPWLILKLLNTKLYLSSGKLKKVLSYDACPWKALR